MVHEHQEAADQELKSTRSSDSLDSGQGENRTKTARIHFDEEHETRPDESWQHMFILADETKVNHLDQMWTSMFDKVLARTDTVNVSCQP